MAVNFFIDREYDGCGSFDPESGIREARRFMRPAPAGCGFFGQKAP